jgi:hypothetical protein
VTMIATPAATSNATMMMAIMVGSIGLSCAVPAPPT